MLKVSIKFDKDALERQMMDAAEKQLREKLRAHGLGRVKVKASRKGGQTGL